MAITPEWKSEYEEQGQTIWFPTESPATKRDLQDRYEEGDPSWVVDESHANLVSGAVREFYFVKSLDASLRTPMNLTSKDSAEATELMMSLLWKSAIVAVAALNDEVGSKGIAFNAAKTAREAWESTPQTGNQSKPPHENSALGRTKSLPHMIDRTIYEIQKSSQSDTGNEINELQALRRSLNADNCAALRYVRHFRNKYAGHASHDLALDQWGMASEKGLAIPIVEEALAIIVRAYSKFWDIAARNPAVADAVRTIESVPPENEGSLRTAAFHWPATAVFASVGKERGKQLALALRDQMDAPPGYGDSAKLGARPHYGAGADPRDLLRRIIDHAGRWTLDNIATSPGLNDSGLNVVVAAFERQDPWTPFPGTYLEEGHASGYSGWHLPTSAVAALLDQPLENIARRRKAGDLDAVKIGTRWLHPTAQFIYLPIQADDQDTSTRESGQDRAGQWHLIADVDRRR